MNKIYTKVNNETRDSKWVSAEYRAAASVLAKSASQLDYLRNKLNYLMQLTGDNGDPFLELNDAVNKMGMALASCIVYSDAYEMEANEAFEPPTPESDPKISDDGDPEEIEDEQDVVQEISRRRRTKDVSDMDKN